MNKKQRETLKKSVKKFMANKQKWNKEHPDEAEEKRIEHEHAAGKKHRARKRRRAKKKKKELLRQQKKAEQEAGTTLVRKK